MKQANRSKSYSRDVDGKDRQEGQNTQARARQRESNPVNVSNGHKPKTYRMSNK